MKRIGKAVAWMLLIGMAALAPFLAASLTAERENPVQKSYYSWTGVLRLWKCEGWQSGNGTLTAWLNRCIERFEKKHPGVYIQMTDVSQENMRAFMEAGINPPDMILYAPGMLEAPYQLMVIEEELPVRKALEELGKWEGQRYAAPVALGGYALAVNSQLLSETPADWSALTPLEEGKSKQKRYYLNVPADNTYISWSGALISMFAGSYAGTSSAEPGPVGEGIDLGLQAASPRTTAQPEIEEERVQGKLPAVLPEDFGEEGSVYAQFASGKIAAMPATQREIRRLQLLSETGKAPDWRAESIGLPFTDQAALFSIVAWERKGIEARQALCLEFMNLMLSEEMQGKLTVSRAFPVREMAALYSGNQGMSAIEAALNSDELLAAPAFGDDWRSYARRLMSGVHAGEGTQEAYNLLAEMVKLCFEP